METGCEEMHAEPIARWVWSLRCLLLWLLLLLLMMILRCCSRRGRRLLRMGLDRNPGFRDDGKLEGHRCEDELSRWWSTSGWALLVGPSTSGNLRTDRWTFRAIVDWGRGRGGFRA